MRTAGSEELLHPKAKADKAYTHTQRERERERERERIILKALQFSSKVVVVKEIYVYGYEVFTTS